jgi:hypothetical protein
MINQKKHNNQQQAAVEETLAAVATSIATAMAKATAVAMSRRVMGHQVWGRCQAAEGSRNGNRAEMGTKWVCS